MSKEKAPRKYNRKCMIKSCHYVGSSGFVKIPIENARRQQFCEILGVSTLRPGDRLCRRRFLPTDFGAKCLKRTAIPTQNLVRFIFSDFTVLENQFKNLIQN